MTERTRAEYETSRKPFLRPVATRSVLALALLCGAASTLEGRGGNTSPHEPAAAAIAPHNAAALRSNDIILTDADLQRALPILHALLRQRKLALAAHARSSAADATSRSVVDAIKSGQIDPGEWIERNVPSFAPPPGSVYDARCSRVDAMGMVRAAYALGEGESYGQWTARDQEEYDAWRRSVSAGGDVSRERDEAVRSILSTLRATREMAGGRDGQLIRRAIDFHRSRGYTAADAYEWHAPDSTHSVFLFWQPYTRALCPHLGPQPLAVVYYHGDFHGGAWRSGQALIDDVDAVVARSGWTREEWGGVYHAMVMAHFEADNPEQLEMIQQVSPEAGRVRRSNVEWFRRHARELKPLLDELTQPPPW